MCNGTGDWALISSLPHLKTLRITDSRLSATVFEELLSSCASLHTFVYEMRRGPSMLGQCVMNFGSDHFPASDAVKYLRCHRRTLKSLHLDLRMRGWSYATGRSRLDFNLRDFIALEHLFINLDAIYVSGRLQSSAEYQFLIQLLPPTSCHSISQAPSMARYA